MSGVTREIGRSGVGAYLVKEVKKYGGTAEKLTWAKKGGPDYLVTWPANEFWECDMQLVETKAPKGSLEDHQIRDHARRARQGIFVKVLYTKGMIDDYTRVYART